MNNIIISEELQELQDKSNWRSKKLRNLDFYKSAERIGFSPNKLERIKNCGEYLDFKIYKDGTKKLHNANFCKVRLCPMCAWRRTLKVYGQVSKIMNFLQDNSSYRFLFLTLTCKNVSGDMLSSQIDNLFKSFRLFTKNKRFKAIKGYFRALEVTYNREADSYHPHFHAVLMVNSSYFTDKNYYISYDDWREMWRKAMRVKYAPQIDIRSFKAGKSLLAKSISEVAKYTVKDTDYLIRSEDGSIDNVKTDEVIKVLDRALYRRRLIGMGGLFKSLHMALNLDDALDGNLIDTDNSSEIREDLSYMIHRYKWFVGFNNFYKIAEFERQN